MLSSRKTARFVVKKDVLINSTVKGYALDISDSGMFIHSHIPFPAGTQVGLEFTLNEAEPSLRIRAVVQHLKPGVGVGMMFSDLSPADAERISRFITTVCDRTTNTRKKVLIVDDSATVRMMFRGCIEMMECEVREANDGREALKVIEEAMPDLVLLDLFMEGMDGFQFLETARADAKLKDMKVVILTGSMSPDVKARLAPFGVLDFFPKMMTTPKKLAEKIQEYLLK